MFPVDPTLPPPNLRTLLPRPETPWMISPSLFNRLQDVPGSNYRKCEILNQDPEWEFILRYFCAQKPANKSIARAYCIHNGALHTRFESNIAVIEQEAKNPHFTPKWRTDAPNPLREKVIGRWNALTDPYANCIRPNVSKDQMITSAKIIPLWHGTKEAICQSICSTGFTTFGKHALVQGGQDTQNTDAGYFGSGIYFTTSANYAATIYSDGNLLLAWVSMREPYPVIADRAHPQKPTDMKTLGTGLGAYQNHNAHYIPVISIQPNNPKCAVYYPCTETQNPALDEVVVFNASQTLARFWIELGPDLLTDPLKLPTMTTFNHLLEYILKLLDTEAVQQNPQLHQILEQKSEVLLAFNLNNSLTAEDLKFYNCTLKLLDQTGKVRNVILKQLQQSQTPPSTPPRQKQFTPTISLPPSTPIITPVLQPTPVAIPACAFGKARWNTHFGDIGIEPPLPLNINQILQGSCPIWPGKIVQETHILVLIPATVNGQPFTLKSLGELIKNPRTGPATEYRYFDLGEYQDTPVSQSYWTLMTRNVLEGSRSQNYATQKSQVATLVKKTGISYDVPKLLEATTAILMHHVTTGQKIYSDSPYTWTRCQEKWNKDWQVVVGGFSAAGLYVSSSSIGIVSVGGGCSRKF